MNVTVIVCWGSRHVVASHSHPLTISMHTQHYYNAQCASFVVERWSFMVSGLCICYGEDTLTLDGFLEELKCRVTLYAVFLRRVKVVSMPVFLLRSIIIQYQHNLPNSYGIQIALEKFRAIWWGMQKKMEVWRTMYVMLPQNSLCVPCNLIILICSSRKIIFVVTTWRSGSTFFAETLALTCMFYH